MVVIKWADKKKKGGERRFAMGIGLEQDKAELGGVSQAAYAREAVKYMNARCQGCLHIRADHVFDSSTLSTPCHESWKHYDCKCTHFVEYGDLEPRNL